MSDLTYRIRRLYQELKSIRAVARELEMAPSTIHYHLNKDMSLLRPDTSAQKVDIKTEGERVVVTGKGIKNLEDLIRAAGLDDSWVCVKHTLNAWQALGKDSKPVQLHQVKAYFEKAPAFFVQPLDPLPRYKRKPLDVEPAEHLTLVIPDSQHGFRRIEDISEPGGYRWEPMHDRAACDVIIQVAELLEPTEIVLLGDMLDLGPWSTRWQADPSIRYTTNASLRELYAGLLRPLREACPSAKYTYLAGNHEERINKAIVAKLDEAHGLRSADTLDGDEVLTVENLLALDSLDIEYVGPYGATYWLGDVRIQHGTKARPAGETAAAYLRNATSSMIWGHTHRLEMAQKKILTPSGPRILTAASPGCLCRTDGVVPNAGGGYLDWQQGFCLVYRGADTSKRESSVIHTIPIVDGSCVVYGHKINGDGSAERARTLTGLPF